MSNFEEAQMPLILTPQESWVVLSCIVIGSFTLAKILSRNI